MMAVAWRRHVTGSNGDSGDVAMEGKMAGCCGDTRGGLEEGGKRESDHSIRSTN